MGTPGSELGPLVAGTSSYVDGTFVWTDYVFDDRGPNLVDPVARPRAVPDPRRARTARAVTRSYPEFAAPGNTADLVQLQIGTSGWTSCGAGRAQLARRTRPSRSLGVAFDTDADPATGAAALPGGRWTNVDPLGIDVLIVTTEAGTTVWRYKGSEWQQVRPARRARRGRPGPEHDRRQRPSRLLPSMRGSWRAFGVLGMQNPDGGSWFDGSEEIHDLAFVGDEAHVLWQDAWPGRHPRRAARPRTTTGSRPPTPRR